MIEQSQKAGARVLLVGMQLPPNYGPDYTESSKRLSRELAKRYRERAGAVPARRFRRATRELFQPDRIHPTEAAQPLMLDSVWKALRPLLRSDNGKPLDDARRGSRR